MVMINSTVGYVFEVVTYAALVIGLVIFVRRGR